MSARRPFIPTESYMHLGAKRVVADWLRHGYVPDGTINLCPISLRPNRGAPLFGVYNEYPFGTAGEGGDLWDEGAFFYADYPADFVPTVYDLVKRGIHPKCVCDVAIAHKGNIAAVIEIVHKHHTPAWKIDFLRGMDIDVYEIRAAVVMAHIKRPDHLPVIDFSGPRTMMRIGA